MRFFNNGFLFAAFLILFSEFNDLDCSSNSGFIFARSSETFWRPKFHTLMTRSAGIVYDCDGAVLTATNISRSNAKNSNSEHICTDLNVVLWSGPPSVYQQMIGISASTSFLAYWDHISFIVCLKNFFFHRYMHHLLIENCHLLSL